MEPDTQPPIPPLQPLVNPPVQPHTSHLRTIIFTVIITLACVVVAYFGYQYIQPKQATNQAPITQISRISPTPTSNPTSNWKTYINPIRKYSISYPPDWTIDTSQAELPKTDSAILKISKQGYTLTIMWPNAFGPGLCVFDDESRVGAPDMASYCEGKYVEFTLKNTMTVRRLEKPSITASKAIWTVYTRDQAHFVTVPPTSYSAPTNYDPIVIQTMDQILSTFESTLEAPSITGATKNNSCATDAECGLNSCNCTAELKSDLAANEQTCARYCEGEPKCMNRKCVLLK